MGVLCQYRLWVGEGWSPFHSIRKVFYALSKCKKNELLYQSFFPFQSIVYARVHIKLLQDFIFGFSKSFLSKSPVLTNPSHLLSRLLFHRELKHHHHYHHQQNKASKQTKRPPKFHYINIFFLNCLCPYLWTMYV